MMKIMPLYINKNHSYYFTRFTPSFVGTTGLIVSSSLNSILSIHTAVYAWMMVDVVLVPVDAVVNHVSFVLARNL